MTFDLCPTIPRDRWPEAIDKFPAGPSHPHAKKPKNQGVEESCNCFAVASGIESGRSVRRLDYVELDAAEMYQRLSLPGGGTNMGEVIEEAMTTGYKPLGKITKVFWCPTFDHQMSATLKGYGLASIVEWHINYRPGAAGWVPQGVGAKSTHGIFGYKPAKRPSPSGEWEYGIWHLNTTGSATARRMILSESQMAGSVGSGGSFAIVAVQDEGVSHV